jgi:hypothetical protein
MHDLRRKEVTMMIRSKLSLAATLGAFAAMGTALAGEPAQKPQQAMEQRKAGPETRALLPLAADMTWTGKIRAGAFGEGSPEMTETGQQDCAWSVDGLWLTCDLRSTMGSGKNAKNWVGHVVMGYDYFAKEYRATVVDSMGGANVLSGKLDGSRLTLTSLLEQNVGGKACKGRLSWDWTNPNSIKFVSENSKDGGPFQVVQELTLKPTKKEPLPDA